LIKWKSARDQQLQGIAQIWNCISDLGVQVEIWVLENNLKIFYRWLADAVFTLWRWISRLEIVDSSGSSGEIVPLVEQKI
jgi:hypothetical protein